MSEPNCPKCGQKMEEGFILDDTHGGLLQEAWAEGKPRRSFWLGIRVKREERHPVTTYRCSKCGFLESYAHFS